jgi:hypothetical protein
VTDQPQEPAPEPAPTGKVSWKDKLKSAATQAATQGKQLAEQAKEKVAEQQAKRIEQWENDPDTLWFGASQNPATGATGITKAWYRLTKDRIWIETGVLGTRSEYVPLWAVKDIDVRQSVLQRGKDVGDVALRLDDPALAADQSGAFSFSGEVGSGAHTSGEVLLDNIAGPHALRDMLMPLVSEARQKKVVERQSQYVHHMTPPAAAAPAAAPAAPAAEPVDLADQLKKLAELRDQGILTDEEFAAQKAKLLG